MNLLGKDKNSEQFFVKRSLKDRKEDYSKYFHVRMFLVLLKRPKIIMLNGHISDYTTKCHCIKKHVHKRFMKVNGGFF